MAKMLIRVIDKENNSNIYINARCFKKGDVISICSDNHKWSDVELSSPWWRTLDIKDATETQLSGFLQPEVGDPLLEHMLQIRTFKFDIDRYLIDKKHVLENIPTAFERRNPIRVGTIFKPLPPLNSLEEALSYLVQKPKLDDPLVI